MRRLSLSFAVLSVVACSQPMPAQCVGGIVLTDGPDAGLCVAKCDASKCVAHNACVNNACALICDAHSDCMADTQRCAPAVEDDTGNPLYVCTDTDLKGVGTPCPLGTECPTGTSCHGAGLGDTLAYCTEGCAADTDCPGGYECGYEREPTFICGQGDAGEAYCSSDGKAPKTCTNLSDITASPWNWVGQVCVELRQCFKRSTCSSCTADPDCSLSNQKCVQVGLDFRCLSTCTVFPDGGVRNKDCDPGYHCQPDGFCRPAFTDCVAPAHVFCSPCRYDIDCENDSGTLLECTTLHGNERSCIDPSFRKTCTTNNDCPVAPSGLHGHCLNESDELTSADPQYHHCYVPEPASELFSCYPNN